MALCVQKKTSSSGIAMTSVTDKTFGSLLGLVLADSLGAKFEGLEREHLRGRFADEASTFAYAAQREFLRYTDDGQMALALAEFLTEHDSIEPDSLMRKFVQVYEPWRGYGRGARVLLEAFRDNAEYEFMAEHLFPGGSLGNGGAMRSAPVGLRFLADNQTIHAEAKNSAWPTHRHEVGIEGAQLIALATGFAVNESDVTPARLGDFLMPFCSTVVFQNRIEGLMRVKQESDIETFGNGIEAQESAVTALACFALHPQNYKRAVSTALWQGGDTDTIAAMTGALVGAQIGSEFSHEMPVARLEEGAQFIEYLKDLAQRLATPANS